MTWYIGIDPGWSGAACLDDGDLDCIRFNETERDIADWFANVALRAEIANVEVVALMEQVHSMPRQGVASSFKFGDSNGFIRGLVVANRIPLHRVTPVKWQTYMKCRTGGNKNISKARAQELFPHEKVTHAVADAMLIAHYAREVL